MYLQAQLNVQQYGGATTQNPSPPQSSSGYSGSGSNRATQGPSSGSGSHYSTYGSSGGGSAPYPPPPPPNLAAPAAPTSDYEEPDA